jgi:hypothetical protein
VQASGLTVAVGMCRSSAMNMKGIWGAAKAGDLAEVQRLVGHDPGLLDATHEGYYYECKTPLLLASDTGHVGVVRWLVDRGAAINEGDISGMTALWCASLHGRTPVVKVLLEGGADPSIATRWGSTPLMIASVEGRLEVVRLLLGHPSAKATIDRRDRNGRTAVWWACCMGRGGVARALLESGADPTIFDEDGTTTMAIAKQDHYHDATAEGRRECVAELEVSFCLPLPLSLSIQASGRLADGPGCCFGPCGLQEAELSYQLWKARQVADQQGSGAVVIRGPPRMRSEEGEAKKALLDFAVNGLKGDLFPELMEYMGLGVERKGDDDDGEEEGDEDDDL